MTDFITNTYFSAFLSWTLGYFWFLAMDINAGNALVMLAGMAFFVVATAAVAVAGIIWVKQHVRITIV